ncbi:hypothetical protein F2Q69_00046135 [Brassica cretica]|uniref:Uncharacterized protein n=1 Tax=Brassica cretica TaxID=69181 RepID=A0A8S9Q444_BRACR|nr:hypothetical protein F2Q69_00046135 [Brassica cretica]
MDLSMRGKGRCTECELRQLVVVNTDDFNWCVGVYKEFHNTVLERQRVERELDDEIASDCGNSTPWCMPRSTRRKKEKSLLFSDPALLERTIHIDRQQHLFVDQHFSANVD